MNRRRSISPISPSPQPVNSRDKPVFENLNSTALLNYLYDNERNLKIVSRLPRTKYLKIIKTLHDERNNRGFLDDYSTGKYVNYSSLITQIITARNRMKSKNYSFRSGKTPTNSPPSLKGGKTRKNKINISSPNFTS